MKNWELRDLWSKVFGTVHDMTEDELVTALTELGATNPTAAVAAYKEDEIGREWFNAQAETKLMVFNK